MAVRVPFSITIQDLALANAMPFQSHYEVRVDRPLDDLDLDDLFMKVQENLRVGDKVTICAFADRSWQQLMAVGTVRVVSMRQEVPGGPHRIRSVWTGEIQNMPEVTAPKVAAIREAKLMLKKEFTGGYSVQDEKGAILDHFKTKREAENYIEGKKSDSLEAAPESLRAGGEDRDEHHQDRNM